MGTWESAADQPLDRLRMPGEWFDELASGGGSPEAIDFLVRGERTRRLLLLGELLDRMEQQADCLDGLGTVDSAWVLIADAAERRPDAAEELLQSPQVGSWIGHMLRRLHGSADGPPLWADAGHLFAICLVACARAGLDADLAVPVRGGLVVLPTLGLARLGDPGPVAGSKPEFTIATARLRGRTLEFGHRGSTLSVHPLSELPTAHFRPLHKLRVRPGDPDALVWLDDFDPYRDLDDPIAPDPLDDCEVAAWRRLLIDATSILRLPGPQPGRLRVEDVRCVVPWRNTSAPTPPNDRTPLLSASAGDAFGAMVVSRPADGLALAETLIHEYQHSKLGALLHLFPLLDDDGAEIFYAPWRSDPRHLTGLLHGAYAFVGVTGFWRDRVTDEAVVPADSAAFHFALRRLQTKRVVRTLLAHARLTAAGSRLVQGLAAILDSWLAESVAPEIRARACAAATSHRVEWRLRNHHCAEEERSVLARAYRAGAPPVPLTAFTPQTNRPAAEGHWIDSQWTDDRTFLYAEPSLAPTARRALVADCLLACGDTRAAEHAYAADLRCYPDDRHALAGWLLATAVNTPAHRRLLRRPERFPAALEAAGTRPGEPEMRQVANWLCG